VYNPEDAHQKYLIRRQNRKPYKFTLKMKIEINKDTGKQWSHEQIAGRRKLEGKDTVSHEWIY
jgi:IS30 family transposase